MSRDGRTYYAILPINLLWLFNDILSTIWTAIIDHYNFKINIPEYKKLQKSNLFSHRILSAHYGLLDLSQGNLIQKYLITTLRQLVTILYFHLQPTLTV